MPVLCVRFSCTVPLALMLRLWTAIDQVSPPSLVVGVMILPPATAVPVIAKSAATFVFTSVTGSLKVAKNVTFVWLVNWLAGDKRLIDFNVGATVSIRQLTLGVPNRTFPSESWIVLPEATDTV